MFENRNYIVAIVLSLAVLLGWQFLVVQPRIEEQRRLQEAAQQATPANQTPGVQAPGTQPSGTTSSGSSVPTPTAPGSGPQVPGQATAPQPPAATPAQSRSAALSASPRVAIDTPNLGGSINLRGGRIDDLRLLDYRQTVDKDSPTIVLFSPTGSPNPYYAEFNWVTDPGAEVAVPVPTTEWTQENSGALTPDNPVILAWDNGQGLVFRRTIAVDNAYMFTVKQSVENSGGADVRLYPYGLISRHGEPETEGFYILHEGLIGVFGEQGLREVDYSDIEEEGQIQGAQVDTGWLGITDKYWASALVPLAEAGAFQPRFSYNANVNGYQADYLGGPVSVAAGGTADTTVRLFAGAKEVSVVNDYQERLGLNNFDLLIDWGWFYFITKPMFIMIDWFFKLTGNFGVAILLATVVVKLIFFPLANKSYVSMSRMKLVQPQMLEIRERYKDDKAKQQQAMMELYKKEKINPLAGCLPILVQIPVFFALYKVLYITIEMRHAPFFGWIRDLSAPDPTSIFTLFGLFPWDAPVFLMIGIWPIIMGITMFVQMKMNPAPTEPAQQMIFNWMPVMFTFMLGSFPAGLVIYWAWNNTLSILQQYVIMRRQGVKVELFDNIRSMFKRKSASEET